MAQLNTGTAFYETLTITRTIGNTVTTYTESILNPIPNSNHVTAITGEQLKTASKANIQVRYNAFEAYLAQKYPGLNVAAVRTNVPIEENPNICPIDQQQVVNHTVTVTTEGGGSARVNQQQAVTVTAGSTVTLTALSESGYSFSGWYINGIYQSQLGTTASYEVNGDVTLEARFSKLAPSVYVSGNAYQEPDGQHDRVMARAHISGPISCSVSGTLVVINKRSEILGQTTFYIQGGSSHSEAYFIGNTIPVDQEWEAYVEPGSLYPINCGEYEIH